MESGEKEDNIPDSSWKQKISREWQRIQDHAQTYPYVWGSYIVVYGSFGLYLTYRWQKLRRTEARVRVLQEKLRKLVEEDEAASAGSVSGGGDKFPTQIKVDDKLN